MEYTLLKDYCVRGYDEKGNCTGEVESVCHPERLKWNLDEDVQVCYTRVPCLLCYPVLYVKVYLTFPEEHQYLAGGFSTINRWRWNGAACLDWIWKRLHQEVENLAGYGQFSQFNLIWSLYYMNIRGTLHNQIPLTPKPISDAFIQATLQLTYFRVSRIWKSVNYMNQLVRIKKVSLWLTRPLWPVCSVKEERRLFGKHSQNRWLKYW